MLRSQEEAAIAEAIAILNSDAAFETFGKVSKLESYQLIVCFWLLAAKFVSSIGNANLTVDQRSVYTGVVR